MATGLHKAYVPPIPGIELVESYIDVSDHPHNFTDQRVLIIGKGNSAFETADNLLEAMALIHLASPNPLKFAWKTHYVGDLRAVNNNLLDSGVIDLDAGPLQFFDHRTRAGRAADDGQRQGLRFAAALLDLIDQASPDRGYTERAGDAFVVHQVE